MRFLFLPMALLPALMATAPAKALEVSNFRAGLACRTPTPQAPDRGWICHTMQDIAITDYGVCNYAGHDKPCTWIGFEFDYRGAVAGDRLECEVETSRPVDFGNPGKKVADDSSREKFTIDLSPDGDHFFNPQYFVYRQGAADEATLVVNGRCRHGDKPVFEYVFRLHFPVVPARN
jgi:hypothetical protein